MNNRTELFGISGMLRVCLAYHDVGRAVSAVIIQIVAAPAFDNLDDSKALRMKSVRPMRYCTGGGLGLRDRSTACRNGNGAILD